MKNNNQEMATKLATPTLKKNNNNKTLATESLSGLDCQWACLMCKPGHPIAMNLLNHFVLRKEMLEN
jgi:hypothetical protein